MSILIGVSGKIGSGKSTFTSLLLDELHYNGFNAEECFFASKLKKIVYELCGTHGYTQEEKNIFLPIWGMTVGELLQIIGTDVMRNNFDKDVWIKATLSNLKDSYIYIISDCRFRNEISTIKDKNGITIRLNGDPANIRKESKRDLTHISETALDDYESFDYIYENSGALEDLKQFVKVIANKIFLQVNSI